jgi:arylsulfatase A-like enzyme
MLDANTLVGSHDILLITLDTLRYDVAQEELAKGNTPTLRELLPGHRWQLRHSPATFTYAAHHAFFAGFLPTPADNPRQARLFAARFGGSQTSGDGTCVFDHPTIVEGLAARGYHTACIGGVGFFNKQTPLGSVLPMLFAESHWSPMLGVSDRDSTRYQVELAIDILSRTPRNKPLFLFMNVSAIHQPNYFYLPGATEDSRGSHAAALAYVDRQLAPLFQAVSSRAPTLCIVCSDHGTAYGEDGLSGHRLAHSTVWEVPYAEFIIANECH